MGWGNFLLGFGWWIWKKFCKVLEKKFQKNVKKWVVKGVKMWYAYWLVVVG